jgi:hypothetical protein
VRAIKILTFEDLVRDELNVKFLCVHCSLWEAACRAAMPTVAPVPRGLDPAPIIAKNDALRWPSSGSVIECQKPECAPR